MKKIAILFSILTLILGLCACRPASTAEGGISEEPEMGWQDYYDMGIRYLSEGDYEEAILAFSAAIEIDPKQAPAYVGRGDAYALSGEAEENLVAAKTDYEKAIELDENNAEAYLGLADVYIRQGDIQRALDVLKRGLEKIGNSQEIINKIEEIKGEHASGPYDFEPQIIDADFDMEAPHLKVQVKDSRTATITISGLSLQDSYIVNHSDIWAGAWGTDEYRWEVRMVGEQETYSVATTYWSRRDEEVEKSQAIADMQHNIWHLKDDTSSSYIAPVAMSYTADSISWAFTMPEEYCFEFDKVSEYIVIVRNFAPRIDCQWSYSRIP